MLFKLHVNISAAKLKHTNKLKVSILADTIRESHLLAFCKFFSLRKFVSWKFLLTFFYLYFKLPFPVLFFTEQVSGEVLFLTLLGTLGFLMLLRTGQMVFPSQSKLESVGPSKSICRWTVLIRWKIFSTKLDDIVSNNDDFVI